MYGWLIVSLHVPPAFPATQRHAADALFASVRNAAAEKLARLAWLDGLFKQWAVEKIRGMKTLIWPPDGLLTDEGLMQAYASWFENETTVSTSFFKAWLKAASARQRQLTEGGSGSRGEACLASAKAPPRNYALPYFAYDGLLNTVSVSVAAILSPYFRGPDVNAMRHAGVGLAYALELVRAFDPSGAVKFDAKSDLVNASVLAAWRDQIAKKEPANSTLCAAQTSTAGNPKTGALTAQFFPAVPAMELAHKVFEASLGLKDGTRRAADDLNEERVFFITACLVMCPCPGSFNRYRFDCNRAVANFEPFRRAFNCPNRVEPNKCGFFN
ncbi:hypothetical protein HPB48_018614 [Haemaphysalis longicornis]|uniref:Peptidase M13 C-terminal domain-containing protein n=1 Tax=Haemaphysalis longicornis TaxID=44386 RepID=A0A9J6GEB9_HAELO|nr:hypothetical protein HPB48_018614 [Haemaphysalis longicornis]